MGDDERNTAYRSSPSGHWTQSPRIYSHSHHGTPAQEYQGFNFTSPHMAMEPSAFSNNAQQRSMHHQHLQPLVMPQWPSMLTTQAPSTYQPMYPQPVQSVQTVQPLSAGPLHTPVSATSTRSASTPRKTLTDLDRKRMCQYAEEHPNSKQTEIGTIFGVERSTVSKVLRQKEKYLQQQEDGSRSPAKRPKGRSPDIERALANWARNQEKKGCPLTDELIRRQARAFSTTTTCPEVTLSSSWIEKFKLKNNLMGARSRKASLATDELESGSHSPRDTSPLSPTGAGSPSPLELHSVQSRDSLKHESPDDYIDFSSSSRHVPFHSQSTNSLHSAFTDTAPSSFSPGPMSPTSPFFTPDSGTAPSPFIPPSGGGGRPLLPTLSSNNSNNTTSHRPRSMTFPQLELGMPPNGDATTPKYNNNSSSAILDSPMEEAPDPLGSLNEAISSSHNHHHHPEDHQQQHQQQQQQDRPPHTVTPSETMRPPPLPAHLQQPHLPQPHLQQQQDMRRDSSTTPSSSSALQQQNIPTSPDEARQALQIVLSFFEQQPTGFLDFQESVTIGKLMEKLRLHSSSGQGGGSGGGGSGG